MAYGDIKYLTRRTASDKILCNKPFNIAKNLKHDGYQTVLASTFNNKFFGKKFILVGWSDTLGKQNISAVKNELAEELRKLIIRKFQKRKMYSSLTDNIQDADLADMQLISKFNKRIHFLL